MSHQVGKRVAQSVYSDSYELLAPIGRGADSVTYCARPLNPRSDKQFPEVVALKVVSEHGQVTPEIIERTKREAAALSLVDHPNVLKMYECLANERECYLALEYARHGNLKSILEQYSEPLAPERALKLIIQLLNGLDAIHQAGIIHRDIKPDNILVPNRSVVKISDFSIALLPSERHYQQSSVRPIGTLDYAAPEFLMYGDVSETCDLYAVGVTLFQFLSRNLPFEGNTFSKQLNRKISGIRTPLAEFVSYDTALLEKLFDKALSPDKSRRFQNAREFRHSVEAILGSHALPQQRSQPQSNPAYAQLTRTANPRLSTSMRIDASIATPQSQRGNEQLAKLRSKRERTKTQHIELAAFEMKRGQRRHKFLRSKIAVAASVVGITLALGLGLQVFGKKETAFAALHSTQERSFVDLVRSLPQGLREIFFDQTITAFTTARGLVSGTHTGLLKDLLADEQHVPMAIHGLGVDDRFIVALGIPGWKAQTIALSPDSTSSEIRMEGHGLNISLWIRPTADDSKTIEGTYLEHNSGREGSWTIFRSTPTAEVGQTNS